MKIDYVELYRNDKLPLCLNCVHCMGFSCDAGKLYSVIDGREAMPSCVQMRGVGWRCGPVGALFKAKA